MPIKVLTVTNMYPDGERPVYGIFVREQVETLRRICPDLEIDVAYINPLHDRTAYARSVFSVPRLARNYDLVHVHYGLSGLFMLNPFSRVEVPVAVTLHGGDILPEQGKWMQVRLTRMIVRRASAVVTLNQAMMQAVNGLAKRCEMLPCGIDTSLFYPSDSGSGNPRPLIVFPGSRDRRVKDYPLFQKTVETLSASYGLECDTVTADGLSRCEVAELLRRADLMLMTSVSEGSPQMVKEALACELPVVSVPVGDVAELLDGVKGCGVSADRSPESLAALVASQLCGGRNDGIPGHDRIRMLGLDGESVARKVYELYTSLLQ